MVDKYTAASIFVWNKTVYKILPLLVTVCSFSTFAEETNTPYQDVYVAAGYSSHEISDKTGDAFDAFDGYFGARNIYANSFFVGGEVEGKIIKNSSLKDSTGFKEKYAFSANIPLGKRFELSDAIDLDAYGLIGYSMLKTEPSMDDSSYGFKYGAGVDLNMTDWFIGVRYTTVDLHSDVDQKDISLLVGYKLHSLFN
ncbi:porin family protein [Aliivibrio salmonicida]|nr:porin family protein [Aliivibrio salmonicida]